MSLGGSTGVLLISVLRRGSRKGEGEDHLGVACSSRLDAGINSLDRAENYPPIEKYSHPYVSGIKKLAESRSLGFGKLSQESKRLASCHHRLKTRHTAIIAQPLLYVALALKFSAPPPSPVW